MLAFLYDCAYSCSVLGQRVCGARDFAPTERIAHHEPQRAARLRLESSKSTHLRLDRAWKTAQARGLRRNRTHGAEAVLVEAPSDNAQGRRHLGSALGCGRLPDAKAAETRRTKSQLSGERPDTGLITPWR